MKLSASDQRLYDYNRTTAEYDLEVYSLFLNDGDYEQYQDLIFNQRKDQLIHHQRNLVRALWIRGRFPLQGSKERNYYGQIQIKEYEKLKELL